jgi:hypothetical protein
MAMDFMTIQPMSAEFERAFSAAGKMVTPIRARLDAGISGFARFCGFGIRLVCC